jgi:ATP-binding cassette, subfamily B, bacterial
MSREKPSRLAGMRFLFRLSFHADPWRSTAVLIPSVPLAFAVMAASTRALIDAIPHNDHARIIGAAIVIAITLVAAVGIGFSQFKISVRLGDSIGYELDRRLIELTSQIPGIEHFERPEHLDRMEMLRTQRFALRGAMSDVKWSIEGATGVAVTIAMLSTVHPLLALLPLASIPALMLGGPAQRRIDDTVERTAERNRRALHLFDVATLPGPAKEIRVFGLRDEIRSRYRTEWQTADAEVDRAELHAAALRTAGTVIAAAGYAIALWYLLHLARTGRASAGDLYVAISMATRLTDQMGRSAGTIGALRHARNVADRFVWLDEYAGAARSSPAHAPVPDRLDRGIELRDLSFAYDGADRPSLDGVTVNLPAGCVVALVGENGAGKSTLLKLLFGLYQPTSGEILIDGSALTDLDLVDWREHTAACVQDYARLFLRVGETIGVGDIPRLDDRRAIGDAAGRAAADEFVASLPQGLDEQLGHLFDGIDLSGGQWQKLAIARAMMRTAPLLIALDEPTAALDPLAEHELFERYATAARELARSNGTITILVSHRFSTVRIADLIVVLDDGRISQVGSHDELYAQPGLYRELYSLQADQYR